MKTFKHLALLATAATAAMMSSCSGPSTHTESLTDWQFSLDSAAWESVAIPHSWNAEDGRTAKYYRGKGYYTRKITLSSSEAQQPVGICFEGAAQQSTIYLNGTPVVHHKGGYAPFWVDLTGLVKAGDNELTVVCDNSLDLTLAPIDSDFNKNGGLHNPASLYVFSPLHFSMSHYGMHRLHIATPEVEATEAKVVVKLAVDNATNAEATCDVVLSVYDAQSQLVLMQSEKHTFTADSNELTIEERLQDPHLWNGVKDPYLYTAVAEIKMGGTVVDRVSSRFGVRTFAMDKDNGFMLNGQPYPLRGVSIHQDLEGHATAMHYDDYIRDYEIVTELGCNFVRLAHYPHNTWAFDICDSLGLVVQTEIPWLNVCGERAEPAYKENLLSQMVDMVESHQNHPSIMFWGMFNEVAGWGNKPHLQGAIDYEKITDYVSALYDLAKSLDPYRYVGITDCELLHPESYPLMKFDYVSENRYYGWYYGTFDQFEPAIASVHDKDKVTNVSEYGAGVDPWCHTWNPDSVNNKDNARHYEEWGNLFHESHYRQILDMPWLNFTSLWVMFDFAVASRKEGYMSSDDGVNFIENPARFYTNDKGLVTRDRQVKKDVFYFYKSLWNHDVETIYITSRRLKKIPADWAYTIKVYSNAKSLTLYRGDEKLQTLEQSGEATGVVWEFAPVKLEGPQATFRVVSADGTEDSVTFEAL